MAGTAMDPAPTDSYSQCFPRLRLVAQLRLFSVFDRSGGMSIHQQAESRLPACGTVEKQSIAEAGRLVHHLWDPR